MRPKQFTSAQFHAATLLDGKRTPVIVLELADGPDERWTLTLSSGEQAKGFCGELVRAIEQAFPGTLTPVAKS